MKSTRKSLLFIIAVVLLSIVVLKISRSRPSVSASKEAKAAPTAWSPGIQPKGRIAQAPKPTHTSQQSPVPSYQTNSRFPGSVVLDSRDGALNADGQFTRVELL